MKQIITTTLTIAKPQRLALFLITLFLLPSTAWGQDNVTGTSIFTDVSDNSGKFTFTYGDGSTPGLEWEAIRGTADSNIEKNNDGSGIILKKPENQAGAIGFTSKFVVSGNISAGQKLFVLTLGGITGATLTITTTKGDGTLVRTLVNQRSLNSTTIEITADQSIQFDNECLNFAFNLNTTDVQLNQIQFYNMSFAYGITVAGISTATTGSISGDGITGSVLFDNSTKTLTLNGATINDDITWYDSGNLTIEVKGNNTINSGSKYPLHIMKSGTKVSFTTNQDAPGILTLKSTASDFSASKFYDGEGQVDFTNSVMYAEANNNDVVIQKITPYGLTVAGISVTGANAMDISGSGIDGGTGSVKFNVATSTLTLNNAQITGQIESSLSGLNIELIGDNKINASSYSSAIVSTDSSSPLTIKTAESDPLGALNISQNSDPNNTAQIISGFSSVQLSDGLIATCGTSGLYNDLENKYSYAYIAKLLVNQLPVTATNCGNILSDGTVSFVSSNNILTLDNAQALTSISTGFGALTIHLKGNNSIDASGDDTNPPAIMGPGSLTFTKEGDDVKLSMKASGVSVIMNFTSVNYEDAGLYLNTSTPNTGYDTEKKKFYFARNEGNPMNDATLTTKVCYPLWIEENSQATADNINTINNGWGMNDKGELVLSNYSKTNYGSNAIMSNMDNLTINLIGKNTIGCKNDYAPIYSLKSTAQLTFNTDDSDPGSLTLTSSKNDQDKDGKVIKGFSNDDNPTFNNGLGWTSSTENGVTTAAITRVTSYLKIGSVIVTDDNAGNIQGDGITGTVTYNATNTTLTLNTATINGSIKSNIDNLVVHLIGSSTITPSTSDAPFQYTGTNGSLTFESSEADDGELTLGGAVSENGSGQNITLSSGDYNYSNTFGTGESVTTFGDWIIDYPDSKKHIYYNPHYGITVNNYEVTKKNKDMVTSLAGNDFKYLPEDQALLMPTNTTLATAVVKSHRDNLTIYISGNCVSSSIVFEQNSNFTATSGTLTIKNAPSSTSTTNKLTLQNSTGAVISGFSTVTLDGLFFSTPNYPSVTTSTNWTSSINEAIITNVYGITIGDIAVTTANKDDVLNNGGKVKFTPADNTASPATPATLTLDGAVITGTISWTKSAPLTIAINGTNSVTTTDAYAIEGNNQDNTTLTIAKVSETGKCKLILSGSSVGSISGFKNSSDTYAGSGLVYYEDQAEHTATILSTLSGSGTSTDPYLIETPEDLKDFSFFVNKQIITNKYIKIANNIDCKDLEGFESIGSSYPFMGTLSGYGNTISNLTINSGLGFFGHISGGIVNDLNFYKLSVKGNSYATGGIASELSAGGQIDNCTLTECTIACLDNQYSPEVGGIVARLSGSTSTISNCVVYKSTINASTTYTGGSGPIGYAGGIVASYSSGTITNCHVKDGSKIINVNADGGSTLKTGALVGNMSSETTTSITSNFYYYDVTVETQLGSSDKETKSGYTPRGTNDNTDPIGAMLYTKDVIIPISTDAGHVSISSDYYKVSSDNITNTTYSIAPDVEVVISVENADVEGSYTLDSETKTIELNPKEGSTGLYTFDMPNADVTFTVQEAAAVHFSEEGQIYASYYNAIKDVAVPMGMTAYIVTGVSEDGTKVIVSPVSYIKKGVAVLIEKDKTTEVSETTDFSGNKLIYAENEVPVTTGSKLYVLYQNQFVKVTSGTQIPTGKNYLDLSTFTNAGTRGFYDIGGANDGTSALRGVVAEGTNGKSDAWYTLQGRRLSAKPTKSGLYLHNGAKVVIK